MPLGVGHIKNFMINKPLNVEGTAKKEYELLPKDVYQVQLEDIELKEQQKYQSLEMQEVLNFTFVVIEEGKYYGRKIWQTCSQKMAGGQKQSNLYKVLSALEGREFTIDECINPSFLNDVDFMNGQIGKQLRLTIGQKVGEQTGKMKNFIDSFLPVKTKLPAYNKEQRPSEATGEVQEEIPSVEDMPEV